MKLKVGKISLFVRLGAMAGVLLFGQQAMAIGTAAGTAIDNTADVNYDVATIPQTVIQSSVSFVVDRRVDFTLTQLAGALEDVNPGETGAFFDFTLTNDSNSEVDFSLLLTQIVAPGTVRGIPDTANMAVVDYAVSAECVSGCALNGDPDPIRTTGDQFVDELPADAVIRIRVFGNAALTMLDGQVAGVLIDATAGEPGLLGTEGAPLTEDPNTDLGIENVFADAGNDGVETNEDGFIVETADLAVTKSYAVIAGDLGSGLPIPGATVEYTIEIINSSTTTDATAVVITDAIDTDVTLDLNVALYGGEDINVDNAGTQLTCNVEDNADGDGCDLVGTALTILDIVEVPGAITVAFGTTLTIQYQVTIPDPDPTP